MKLPYVLIKRDELRKIRARNDYLDREIQASHKEYWLLAQEMHPYIDKLIRAYDRPHEMDFLSITTEFSALLLVNSIGEWRDLVAREIGRRVEHFVRAGVVVEK